MMVVAHAKLGPPRAAIRSRPRRAGLKMNWVLMTALVANMTIWMIVLMDFSRL